MLLFFIVTQLPYKDDMKMKAGVYHQWRPDGWNQRPFEFFRGNFFTQGCLNDALKNQGNYYIRRTQNPNGEMTLVAKLREDPLANGMASVRGTEGRIIDTKVEDGSQNCGLEHQLLAIAFDDTAITGNRGFISHLYEAPSAFITLTNTDKMREHINQATKNCETVVGVDWALPAHVRALLMQAGCQVGVERRVFDMMFLMERGAADVTVRRIQNMISEASHADGAELLQTYGKAWYFCKCKTTKHGQPKQQCLDMQN